MDIVLNQYNGDPICRPVVQADSFIRPRQNVHAEMRALQDLKDKKPTEYRKLKQKKGNGSTMMVRPNKGGKIGLPCYNCRLVLMKIFPELTMVCLKKEYDENGDLEYGIEYKGKAKYLPETAKTWGSK